MKRIFCIVAIFGLAIGCMSLTSCSQDDAKILNPYPGKHKPYWKYTYLTTNAITCSPKHVKYQINYTKYQCENARGADVCCTLGTYDSHNCSTCVPTNEKPRGTY